MRCHVVRPLYQMGGFDLEHQSLITPVIKKASYYLAHVPSMIRHGSKPSREIALSDQVLPQILNHLNSFENAVAYPPNQIYIGNMEPDQLASHPTPWYQNGLKDANRFGPFGEIMPEDEFYGILQICDEFNLLLLEKEYLEQVKAALSRHPLITEEDCAKLEGKGGTLEEINKHIAEEEALPLYAGGDRLIGCSRRDHDQDESLFAGVLYENLTVRASGVMALRNLMKDSETDPFDYLIGCGEEAVGDRYQRGGGNMAKAIGELCACPGATGSDTKAFCCGPVHAILIAAGLVASGIFKNVAVIAGGSFAKLGMKFQGHLRNDMPILEDVIAGLGIWITGDDGVSPQIRLDSVGKHTIGSGSSQQVIFEKLVVNPLDNLGLKLVDVDKYATEMHNPELTEPQGSGNVPRTNYRIIASYAALRGEIEKSDLEDFIVKRGMLGFSPTQGHIASAVPVLGHAVEKIKSGDWNRTLFLAKGSLFLGRMTQMADGVSFLLEKNSRGS